MKTLHMTAVQRLQVDCLLMAQRGSLGDLIVLTAIRDKVVFPPAERQRYLAVDGAGNLSINTSLTGDIPPVAVALENEEARRLLEVVDKWPSFGLTDCEWLTPLRGELTAAEGK
jgi:hypothetical protein